jgi:hypothetical protein
MALVNVGQKGKVSTQKVYIDILRNSLFYRGCSEIARKELHLSVVVKCISDIVGVTKPDDD